MTLRKEIESFDDMAEMLQEEENRKNLYSSKKQVENDSVKIIRRQYYRRKTPVIMSIDEYKQKVKEGFFKEIPIRKSNTSENENLNKQNSKISNEKKILKFPKGRIAKKRKDNTRIIDSDKGKFNSTKQERKNKKRIKNMSKQIEKNLTHKLRYTEPKKRNLLSRIILQHKLSAGEFEDIEDDYDFFSKREIDESKNAIKRVDRKLYKEVQAYEDAKDDVRVRKGWKAFKIGLAASLLAGSLAVATHVGNEIKGTIDSHIGASDVLLETMNEEDRINYENSIEQFLDGVEEKDGYIFSNITDMQIQEGYLKILNKEKRMIENNFVAAFYHSEDQDLLDKIVLNSFGEEEYSKFSSAEKRDYRQLAFELLPISLPSVFKDSNKYIRNPIVYDALQARNTAKEKGYKMELIVNSDEIDTVKRIGKLIHNVNTIESSEYQFIDSDEKSQQFLEEMIKSALEDKYDTLSKKDLRDYKQIAYELLPDELKQNYIKDPIDIEKMEREIEIGE